MPVIAPVRGRHPLAGGPDIGTGHLRAGPLRSRATAGPARGGLGALPAHAHGAPASLCPPVTTSARRSPPEPVGEVLSLCAGETADL
jgi:hypothetical protein